MRLFVDELGTITKNKNFNNRYFVINKMPEMLDNLFDFCYS